jgi:hypothetical protein
VWGWWSSVSSAWLRGSVTATGQSNLERERDNMKTKIFWRNVLGIFDKWFPLAGSVLLGSMLGMTTILGQAKADTLTDAVLLASFINAFTYFELFLLFSFLLTLVKVIIESLHDKHPIRNQEKDDYLSTKSVVIYNALPKEDQERIDALDNLLYETYLAAHPAKPKKKFSLNFGAKHND